MRTHVWIRVENEKRWEGIKDKSAWINSMIASLDSDKSGTSRTPAAEMAEKAAFTLYESSLIPKPPKKEKHLTCKMHDLYVIPGRKTCMMKGCK